MMIFAGYFVFQNKEVLEKFKENILELFIEGRLLIGNRTLDAIIMEDAKDWLNGFYSFKFMYELGNETILCSEEKTIVAWSQPVINGYEQKKPVAFRIAA